ncbi:hypothetical protein Micr_00830 [Candidatus Micrarchaeum sp.]|jgi:hypothetical protein|nr:MAG: hypothetical protein B2I19_01750 [Thermoplasmatales archaeon ARMAN]QRF74294.1 hypothetical protein Micr_00830 [Candidatus Micrarchaeum sp.]
MALMRAKENEYSVYYISEPGLIKLTTYSRKFSWGVFLIAFILFWLFIGIGGVVGGVIVGFIVTMILDAAISSPKITKWDKLAFGDLKKEKDALFIKWSDVKSAVFDAPEKINLVIENKNHKMKILTNFTDAEKLLQLKLGNKLEIRKR